MMKNIHLLIFVFIVVSIAAFGQPRSELDQYGGWTQLKFNATGFFRIEKTPDRYWLVTPEGNAFISNGINHVTRSWMRKNYNKTFWTNRCQELFNESSNSKTCFEKKVKQDMDILGMNTLGEHSPIRDYQKPFMPYVYSIRFVEIHHWNRNHTKEDFVDVFSPSFVNYCDSRARQYIAPNKNDPYLFGYALTDGPILTDYEAQAHGNNIYGWARGAIPSWPQVLRNLGPESPGKVQYVLKMQTLYDDSIDAFNNTYGTSFTNFDELKSAQNWRTVMDMENDLEVRDNLRFLYVVLDKCYDVVTSAIRKYDPNHLILGDKLNGNTNHPDSIYAIAAKHFDVFYCQYYAFWEDHKTLYDRFAKLLDKPILQGDASINVPSSDMTNPFGPHCANQIERVDKFKEMYYNAFKLPNFIGWHWCGYIDSYDRGGQTGKQHGGIQDPFDNWHPIKDAMKAFSDSMYYIASTPVKSLDDNMDEKIIPASFQLQQNYPNPFNQGTTIQYDIHEKSFVEINLYDMQGRMIRELVRENLPTDIYQTDWDGFSRQGYPVPTGIYLCEIRVKSASGRYIQTRKMMLIR